MTNKQDDSIDDVAPRGWQALTALVGAGYEVRVAPGDAGMCRVSVTHGDEPAQPDDVALHRVEAHLAARARIIATGLRWQAEHGDAEAAEVVARIGAPGVATEVERLRARLAEEAREARKWANATRDARDHNDCLCGELHSARFRNKVLAFRLAELERLADCARAEHTARTAWLATLPEGSCSTPPPQALLDAEAATRAALDAVDGGERR